MLFLPKSKIGESRSDSTLLLFTDERFIDIGFPSLSYKKYHSFCSPNETFRFCHITYERGNPIWIENANFIHFPFQPVSYEAGLSIISEKYFPTLLHFRNLICIMRPSMVKKYFLILPV